MSLENNPEQNYRLGYLVCGIFLIGFILVTWAVISDSHHRPDLEQVVSLATPRPSP
jgi:hypothetical protein